MISSITPLLAESTFTLVRLGASIKTLVLFLDISTVFHSPRCPNRPRWSRKSEGWIPSIISWFAESDNHRFSRSIHSCRPAVGVAGRTPLLEESIHGTPWFFDRHLQIVVSPVPAMPFQ
jgi:hypothetical protein